MKTGGELLDGFALLVGELGRHAHVERDEQRAALDAATADAQHRAALGPGLHPDRHRRVERRHRDLGTEGRLAKVTGTRTVRSLPRRPKSGCGSTDTTT